MKKKILALVLIASTTQAHATGFPTVDIANLAQQLMQYMELLNQVETLSNQLSTLDDTFDQARDQFESMTGSRGLANLLEGDLNRNYIPDEIMDAHDLLSNGGDIGSAARAARDADQLFDEDTFVNPSGYSASVYKKKSDQAYGAKSLGDASYKEASQRIAVYRNLMDEIDSTSDPKAIADLQARIQGESLMLQNEYIRLQAMQQSYVASQDIAKQNEMQMRLNMRRGSTTGF